MRAFLFTFLIAFSLGLQVPTKAAAQIDLEVEACVPRAVSVESPGGSGVPPFRMSFEYDAKGKLRICPGAILGTDQISGSATLGKLVNGKRTFTVAAKGMTIKSLSISLKGEVGAAQAACVYRGSAGQVTVKDLPVTLECVSPVPVRFTLLPQVDARGKITGSGKIVSGFANDCATPAILTGVSNKTVLKWQLKQGTQRVSFTGKKGANGFIGTLAASVPPANATYKNFLFPGFQSQLKDGATRFRGSVSLAASGAYPDSAHGAVISVATDLDQNGAIEAGERFSATSDEAGEYCLECPVADGGRALLEITMEGYAPQLKVLEPIRAGAEVLNHTTLRPLVEMTFSENVATAQDGKLELVDLPPVVSTIQARVFNPACEAEQFPGEFADDRGSLLISSVFTSIEARDDAGGEVTDLRGGALLRMQVPKDTWTTLKDLRSGTGQIDCPLYYYDEAAGEWRRSEEDGWLETSQRAKIPENQLVEIQQGTYEGSVFVAGPITHLSYWNLDWPVEDHACITGRVVDESGLPVAGASVEIRGLSYTGSTSGQVTGADGRFCADVMRSEVQGEDVDGNGKTGETQQVTIGVSHQGQVYRFGPYGTPISQATCEDGGCQDIGSLRLAAANRLTAELCTITGTARFAEDSAPVINATVFGFDDALDPEIFFQFFTNSAISFVAATDAGGKFTLMIPAMGGPTVSLSYNASIGDNTWETGYATVQLTNAASVSVSLEVERYRTSTILDHSGAQVGVVIQHGREVSGYVDLLVDDLLCWAVPPETGAGPWPSVPGDSVSWDLHVYDGEDEIIESIVFTATTAIGGTWSTTGVSRAGTWGN